MSLLNMQDKRLRKGVNSMFDKNEMWDFLIDMKIATEEELQLVTDLMGFSRETLESVLHTRTGYVDMTQYVEAELNEFYGIERESE